MVSTNHRFERVDYRKNFFQAMIRALIEESGHPPCFEGQPEVWCVGEGRGEFTLLTLSENVSVAEFFWQGSRDLVFDLENLAGVLWLGLMGEGNCRLEPKGQAKFYRLEASRSGMLSCSDATLWVAGGRSVRGMIFALKDQKDAKKGRLLDLDGGHFSLDEIAMRASRNGVLSPRLSGLTQILLQPHGGGLKDRLDRAALYYQWLSEWMGLGRARRKAEESVKPRQDRIEALGQYLEDELSGEHSLHSLARRFGLNEFQLKNEFKRHYGVPVFAYLRELRLQQAAKLLGTSDQSILEIALAVGFSNPSHFTRAFRERFHVNPSEFRRKFSEK